MLEASLQRRKNERCLVPKNKKEINQNWHCQQMWKSWTLIITMETKRREKTNHLLLPRINNHHWKEYNILLHKFWVERNEEDKLLFSSLVQRNENSFKNNKSGFAKQFLLSNQEIIIGGEE